MDNVVILRGDQGFLGLHCEFPEICPGERRSTYQFVERFPGDQFHDHIRAVVVGAHIVNSHDMRVLQRCERTSFTQQLGGRFLLKIVRRFGEYSFDRHLAIHPGIKCAIDGTNATLANFPANLISVFHRPDERNVTAGWPVTQSRKPDQEAARSNRSRRNWVGDWPTIRAKLRLNWESDW